MKKIRYALSVMMSSTNEDFEACMYFKITAIRFPLREFADRKHRLLNVCADAHECNGFKNSYFVQPLHCKEDFQLNDTMQLEHIFKERL